MGFMSNLSSLLKKIQPVVDTRKPKAPPPEPPQGGIMRSARDNKVYNNSRDWAARRHNTGYRRPR